MWRNQSVDFSDYTAVDDRVSLRFKGLLELYNFLNEHVKR